ncbi:random slug 5-like isoform A [Chlorella sorokiniana]|uniref:Random slug 5-like isoform A n=1 Tax=Chlorella sorokiniana TaxID=3076 RepID=A0A2P6U291_CHLSO|nr:random slug 5-like isoform B [Chlorella sorokiniana]PRW60437.1 random slug 5-like isoform A [Chlorella sorokiniana]|eukprot:PRW60436.1 random slug 5-like isoform B [Chlorella sorokiniana]
MLRYLRGGSSKAASGGGPDVEALLAELQKQVSEATVQAFAGSSELPNGGATERRALLLRYLRAEKLDVASAAQRLERQAAWRRGWGDVTEEDVAAEIATAKLKLQAPVVTAPSASAPDAAPGSASSASSSGGGGSASGGSDGLGGSRPVLIVKASRHRPGATPQLLNNFIYFGLETASHYSWCPANPDGKIVAIFDLAGLQVKNLDATGLRAAFHMLAEHFPERIATVWMLDAPAIFGGLWKVVSPFIDSNTRKKIRFVSGRAGQEALLEALGPEILPLEYGGRAAEIPIEMAVQQLPAWRQRQQAAQQGGAAAAGAAAAAATAEPKAAAEAGELAGQLHLHTASMRLSESSSNLLTVPV